MGIRPFPSKRMLTPAHRRFKLKFGSNQIIMVQDVIQETRHSIEQVSGDDEDENTTSCNRCHNFTAMMPQGANRGAIWKRTSSSKKNLNKRPREWYDHSWQMSSKHLRTQQHKPEETCCIKPLEIQELKIKHQRHIYIFNDEKTAWQKRELHAGQLRCIYFKHSKQGTMKRCDRF